LQQQRQQHCCCGVSPVSLRMGGKSRGGRGGPPAQPAGTGQLPAAGQPLPPPSGFPAAGVMPPAFAMPPGAAFPGSMLPPSGSYPGMPLGAMPPQYGGMPCTSGMPYGTPYPGAGPLPGYAPAPGGTGVASGGAPQKGKKGGGKGSSLSGERGKGQGRRSKRGKAAKKPVARQPGSEDGSEDEDMQHFADVCYSLVAYPSDAANELKWIEESFASITDPHDRALLLPSTTPKLIEEMRQRAAVNAAFLAMLVESDEDARQFSRIPRGHAVQEQNSVKVRTVLRQFVRDWAEEGAKERDSQYGCLLRALQKYVPLERGAQGAHTGCCPGKPRVLTPGSGLARLPFEVARLGYHAQGNEFSYHMLQGSKWVLNETSAPYTHTIFPFVLGLEHRRGSRDHLRGIKIPDICPSDELCPNGVQIVELSMCAGEFVEVYAPQKDQWDAVLTCFFLDTAKNVFLYIRTIAHITRPGGIWANIGPLLYHYAEQPSAISIELSWEEVKPAIEKYFDFKEEEVRQAYYTTNTSGMFHTRYRCKYFVAVRNNIPTSGASHPVF